MAKKNKPKYKHFQLHGKHTNQEVLVYIVVVLTISFMVGIVLKMQFLTFAAR